MTYFSIFFGVTIDDLHLIIFREFSQLCAAGSSARWVMAPWELAPEGGMTMTRRLDHFKRPQVFWLSQLLLEDIGSQLILGKQGLMESPHVSWFNPEIHIFSAWIQLKFVNYPLVNIQKTIEHGQL